MSTDHPRTPTGYEPTDVYDVDSGSPSANSALYKRYSPFSLYEWLLEVATLVLSLCLLVAIAAIFWTTDDKPLSDWQFGISLNAVISILTTGCSSALAHGVSEFISQLKWLHFKKGPRELADLGKFDEASRGPWGSIQFLYGVKWNLATLGALIAICKLAFDPLAQQVVDYPERQINRTDDGVTIGYAHEYDRSIGEGLFNHVAGAIPQDPAMQAAILQGIYDINVPQIFRCPGACKWDEPYISFGFASSCENVTVATLSTEDCPTREISSEQGCNMTTPKGVLLSTHHVDTDSQTTFRLNASSTLEETPRGLPNDFPAFITLAVYRATSDGNFDARDINITECALSLTAYEYSGAHANGSDFEFDSVKQISLPHDRWNYEGGSFVGDGSLWTNASKADGLPKLSISYPDLKALQFFFESDMISAEWVDGNYENTNPGISAALIGDVDLEERFKRMAASMTDHLRAGPNRRIAKGQNIDRVAFVSIRWVWLIGPIVIELAALMFAIITIARNRRSRNVPLWKGSALAVFACEQEPGIDNGVGLIRSKVKDIKEIENIAEKSRVQLE